ncbi:pyrimidine-nucleoside phosphorylase [Lachnospiraceae bacterium KM106-2]|nr:pyrimidine-nucleoside phosphorylase [Lachnospiraceae bacterium KM106-2]
MRMYDIIEKKKHGKQLTEEEIRTMIAEYTQGDIPDYQMSAFLMAVCFQGMNEIETAVLTDAMAHSGDMVDLSSIHGIKVDKHSTGGVGDKTTLIVGPIVAACGVKVAKMSGRGLGFTGGTLDKLESIPGFHTTLPIEQFYEIVNQVGISVIGQSGNITPADKKLYALRDVTATVDSIPLIASSIMSKKLAAGSDCIVLDVKTGSGAFMKTLEGSMELAQAMVRIGKHAGKKVVALITSMERPLGNAIGNALEVKEAVETLRGNGPKDLQEICVHLAANMLFLANKGSLKECMELAEMAIQDQSALRQLEKMIEAQGGDSRIISDLSLLPKAPFQREVKAVTSGYIHDMNAEQCGIASMLLGAGRKTKESKIDFGAGIKLKKKTGDHVETGETLGILYASKEQLFESAEEEFLRAYTIKEEMADPVVLIQARVTEEKVERF